MKSLTFLSGGVESTSLMKYILTETEDAVSAIHIFAPNELNRADLEWSATKRVSDELQKIRPFELKRIDICFPWLTCDPEVQCTIIPALMKGSKADRFLRGLCKEDLYPSGTHENRDRLREWVQFWLKTTVDVTPDLDMFYWPKKQHMFYIQEYLELTFSCLSPVNNEVCGECRSCNQRKS